MRHSFSRLSRATPLAVPGSGGLPLPSLHVQSTVHLGVVLVLPRRRRGRWRARRSWGGEGGARGASHCKRIPVRARVCCHNFMALRLPSHFLPLASQEFTPSPAGFGKAVAVGVFVRDILLDQVCWADCVRTRAPGAGSAAGAAVPVRCLVCVERVPWVPLNLECLGLR